MTEPTQHVTTCDGQTFKRLAEAGKLWLEHNYKTVNDLNVFPVPDGDTGTNMLLTMQNAYREVADEPSRHVGEIARKIAHGAIMGSRGNSGTIMSQIWTGFSQTIKDLETLDVKGTKLALRAAADKAYQGVQSPVEGTILTVIREMAEAAEAFDETEDNLVALLEHVVRAGWAAVEKTPQLLPILREAGKVDSGGAGLMYIMEGMLKAAHGEMLAAPVEEVDEFQAAIDAISRDLSLFEAERYNYDVQFIIKGEGLNVSKIKADIEAMGDSGVIIGSETLVKVHIHVDDPGIPISYGVQQGILADVVVENMQEQYEALLREQKAKQPAPPELKLHQVQPGEIAVVAVAAGDGLARVFAELGVSGIVEGGQTNNPSTEEIVKAIRATKTSRVIVLPNNKNIFLAAKQAAAICEDMDVEIVPTRTFPQGVAAMLSYLPDGDLEEITAAMTEAKDNITTGEITRAIDTVELDGVKVKNGQYIGIVDGKIRRAGDELSEVVEGVLQEANLDEAELVTLYYGAEVTPQNVETLVERLSEKYDTLEFVAVYGGQPHYYYILGIE